jgi:hypothetical protein
MPKERGKYPWGYLPQRVRIEARRKAEITLKQRRQLQRAAGKSGETDYAGFVPIAEFLQARLRLRARVDGHFSYPKGRTAMYSATDMVAGLVGMMVMGLENIRSIAKFALEVGPAQALGLEKFYGEDTLRRMLDRLRENHVDQIREVHRAIRHQERKRIFGPHGDIDVDVDFSGLPARARKREGCVYGYTHGKRQPCYQMWRVCVNGFPWTGDIDPGNVYNDECFNGGFETASQVAKFEPGRRICLRGDTFFYSRDRLQRCLGLAGSRPNFRFYLVAHATRGENHFVNRLVREHANKPGWEKFSEPTEVMDLGRVEILPGIVVPRVVLVRERFEYSHRSGRKRKIRKKIRIRVLLANSSRKEEANAVAVYQKYLNRQIQEHSFCDSKQGFWKLKFPAQEFQANRFWFHCTVLAQAGLWLAQRELIPPRREGMYTKTMRETLIKIGGKNRGASHHSDARHLQRTFAQASVGGSGS